MPVSPQPSERAVTELPPQFESWQRANAKHLRGAKQRGKLPHWYRDNQKLIERSTAGGGGQKPPTQPPRRVASAGGRKPRRTPEEAQRIQKAWLRRNRQRVTEKARQALPEHTYRDGIRISNKAIKEWVNQPHQDIIAKNNALLKIEDLLDKSTYRGSGVDKHNKNVQLHLYETSIAKKKSWITVREFPWGKRLHSISDNPNILNHIKRSPD